MAYRESKTPHSKGKVLDHLRVKEAEGGGHTVEHHYAEDGMMYHKPKVHVFGKDEGAELMAHVSKHANVQAGSSKAEVAGEEETE
jgi:hypothetical protein